MLWSYFPGLTMFEFVNQYHLFVSEQPFPTSHTNCEIEIQKFIFALVLKRDPKLYINHILEYIHQYTSVLAVFYTCSSFGIKNPIPCQESLFTQSRSLNGILYDAKINKSSFDVKQSVLSIGSQYTLVWQTLCQRWRKS